MAGCGDMGTFTYILSSTPPGTASCTIVSPNRKLMRMRLISPDISTMLVWPHGRIQSFGPF